MRETLPSCAILGDEDRFSAACDLARNHAHSENEGEGIGTLAERRLHSVLKFYYESDISCHEIKIGRHFADIVTGGQIIEIQTGDLGRLRKKLDVFLENHTVTVVHPLVKNCTITRIDPKTGESLERYKSPYHENLYSAVPCLYSIKPYLKNPNLALRFVFISVEEFRSPKSKKWGSRRGSVRLERFPEAIHYEIDLSTPEDYKIFLPEGLPENFTSSDVKKLAKCPDPSLLLNVLNEVGIVERIGKKGNSYVYKEK